MPKRGSKFKLKLFIRNKAVLTLVVIGFAAIGAYLLIGSRAATPYTSISATSGVLGGGASVVSNCSESSTNTCVKFGQSVAMDGNVALGFSNPGVPFSPTSFWNTALPASTPVNVNNSTYISAITNQVCHPNGTSFPTSNTCDPNTYGDLATSRWSVPIYIVPANEPCVPIILNTTSTSTGAVNLTNLLANGEPNQTSCKGVPIPANAKPAGGTDAHIAIYQPSSNTLWEFWQLTTPSANAPGAGPLPDSGSTPIPSYGDSQFHAVWGGVMNNVSTSSGVFPSSYAGWASGVSLLGSVIRIDELEAGQINHVVGLGLANPLSRTVVPANVTEPAGTAATKLGFSWPATDSDGQSTNNLAIPEGLLFRFPASLNLSAYNLTPVAKTIAIAVQKYGLVVDSTSNDHIGFHLGDPTPYVTAGLSNPYTTGSGVGGISNGNKGLFGGITGANQDALLLQNFPWDKLQALPFNYGEPGS